MLELEQGKRACRRDFVSVGELSDHFRLSPRAIGADICRIYIIEGLAPNFIADLADHFLMDLRSSWDRKGQHSGVFHSKEAEIC
jgi:hypothetical protein